MIKKILLAMMLTALALPMMAQTCYHLESFDGLRSQGPMPADLKLTLNELYEQDKQRVRDYNGRLTNRDKVLAASYNINKLMASGRIVYGDPISRAVERIADTLLKDYPTLRAQLRFYTVKSPEVNAFATGQGMVFVNTGLVAQVEDEAQLAYVISHEIIHYYREHNTEMLTRKKDRADRMDNEEAELRDFIKRHNRSKEMENEADSLGLAMFYIPSPYDKHVADGIFDVLQYGYLPFDEVPFDTNYFNTPYFKLPPEYFLTELAPITARDDYNDSLSTHPNLLKRRTKTSAQLAPYNGGSHFVTLTEQQFDELRTLARFECVRTALVYGEYARAFYDSYLLLCQYPDNAFLNRALAHSLYGIAKGKCHTATNNAVGNYSDMEGEVQQVYYVLRRIETDEMALIAARRLWDTWRRYPDDKQLETMTRDMFADLGGKLALNRDFFLDEIPATTMVSDTVAAKGSKYARIKAKKLQQAANDQRRLIFTDLLMSDTAFFAFLPQALNGGNTSATTPAPQGNNQLIYCTSYYILDNKGLTVDYSRSYRHESSLYDMVAAVGRQKGLGTVNFSDQSLTRMDNDTQYNEFAALNEWVAEFGQTQGKYRMRFLTQPAMDALMDKYDASLVNISAVLNIEHLGSVPTNLILFGAVIVPALPIAGYQIFANKEHTALCTQLIDARHGCLLASTDNVATLADTPDQLKSQIYANYNQLDTVGDTTRRNIPVPGYCGRRFMVTADLSLSPALGKNTDMDDWGEPKFALGTGATFGLNYATSAQNALAISYNYKRSRQDIALPLSLHTFTAGIRRTHKNCYAPLGPYLGFSLLYARLTSPDTVALASSRQPVNHIGFLLELGRNHVFFDRLVLNYSARYSLTVPMPSSTPPSKDIYKWGSAFLSNVLMLEVGLGLLP